MSKQVIDTTGPTDDLATGLGKANANFTEVYTGQHIHNAAAKTPPVDADEMGLIDSAASNVLKKVTWANIKATLKTYFDGLYAPTNTAPVLGQGIVQGYTVADVPATYAFLEFHDDGTGADGDTFSFTLDSVGYSINQDSVGGDAGGSYTVDDAAHIAAAINTIVGASVATDAGGGAVLVASPAYSSASNAAFGTASNPANIYIISVTSPGTDDVPASGDRDSVDVVSAVSGKSLWPIMLLAQSVGGVGLAGVTVDLKWSDGTVFASLDMSSGTASKDLQSCDPAANLFGGHIGESLQAVINGTIPTGGQVKVMLAAIPQ